MEPQWRFGQVFDTKVIEGELPAWIKSVNSAVWVTDPFGYIYYMNDKSEALLERSASESIGLPCYKVVVGKSAAGKPFCSQNCPVISQAQNKGKIDPVHLRISGANGTIHWVWVLIIAIKAISSRKYWLVHCALDDSRAHRIEEYLLKVSSRTPNTNDLKFDTKAFALTKREEEILQLLSDDETLHSIANSLYVSYDTVRNHVHHILAKLGVHSIMEAVAWYLLVKKN